ncbi:hypothetical protein B1R32_12124 [Abditibacterium utsteinense]|uniref:Heavy-metal resistance n=1 Tax=Abditibacterium utsteinense TaxID=1960156 RepID=A0A2S8SPT8_9BACT|nr:hypothetical protein [Abditibacterium utsteinense]PQV62812.1 hypothetical protein B1R32_12124 [Abditibacterium utsteinense]
MKSAPTKSARRFRLGPATTLAIAASLVIAYMKWPDYAREAEVKRGLEATRAEIARRGPSKRPAPQTLDTIWTARPNLNLSAAQQKSLEALRAEENRANAVLKHETADAAREFSTWMNQNKSGATLAQIQSRAATYSAKSSELSAARREFWERALRLLTPAQRTKIKS